MNERFKPSLSTPKEEDIDWDKEASALTNATEVRERENAERDSLKGRVADLETQNADLERQATVDHLTGLPNRRGFEGKLAVLRGQIEDQYDSSDTHHRIGVFTMLDIDHFKKINDTYGHQAGDHVLQVVGEVLAKGTREGDCIGRLGGEEFVFAFTTYDMSLAQGRAERLRIAIQQTPIEWEGKAISVTMSLGVTEIHAKDTLHELKERADKALYKAKQEGRDQVQFSHAA